MISNLRRSCLLAGVSCLAAFLAGCADQSDIAFQRVEKGPRTVSEELVRLTDVALKEVRIDDPFWSPRIETNRTAGLEHVLRQLEERGALRNFEIAAGQTRGSFSQPWWSDSDVYKWLEGASYHLLLSPDPALEARVDEVIAKLAAAQEEDGYLDTFIQIDQPEYRWRNLGFFHEMFCAGHLFEAAAGHYESTGKTTLLEVASRFADHMVRTFGPGKRDGLPGHEGIELGLVRLYHATGKREYLDLAEFFIDQRGQQPSYFQKEYDSLPADAQVGFLGRTISVRGLHDRFFVTRDGGFDTRYCQDQKPAREQSEAVGHAVRAMYLYSGMTDLVLERGDREMLQALYRLHDNVSDRKVYVTGGVGPSGENEGFTEDYDLPNESAYQETCASIGTMLWNHRMLKLTGNSRYADLLEKTLYNSFLGAVSFSGQTFCYVTPLYKRDNVVRREWFTVPCCPTNVVRILPSLGRYIYSRSDDGLYVHLFVSGEVNTELPQGARVKLTQTTRYPWEGNTRLELELAEPSEFTLSVRIPGWADRYSFRVNGERVTPAINRGYARLARSWADGDAVEVSFPVEVQRVYAHPAVRQDQGRSAIRRGALIYCLEQPDNTTDLDRIYLGASPDWSSQFQENLLNGVVSIRGTGWTQDWDDQQLYQTAAETSWRRIEVTAIPYYAWGNRQTSKMMVWIPGAFPE